MEAFWNNLPATIGAIAAVVAAIGVIINSVLTFLARRDVAANTKVTVETKKATEDAANATAKQLDASTIEATKAVKKADAAVKAATEGNERIADAVAGTNKRLDNGISETLALVPHHERRIASLEERAERIEGDTKQIPEILALVKKVVPSNGDK